MIKYFKNAFKITNSNMILATPLILFLILISLYNGVFLNVQQSYLHIIKSVISILMWTAFFSGWFYFIRKTILLYYENISQEEKIKRAFHFMNPMLKGIGDYFLSFLLLVFLFIILLFGLIYVVHYIGIFLIGQINVPVNDLINISNSNISSTEFIKYFVSKVPEAEIIKIFKWSLLSMVSISSYLYMTFFWIASLFKDTKNPFKALYLSNKFLWKNIVNTVIFFILISVIQFIVLFFCKILLMNAVLSFFSLLVYFYFMVYLVVVIFLYYEKFETKGISNCGSNCIGQDCFCRSSGKED